MIFSNNTHISSLIYSIGEIDLVGLDFFNLFINIQLVNLFEASINKEIAYNFVIAKKFDFLTKLNTVNTTKSAMIMCLISLVRRSY